jgi:hypothetical protein
MWLSLVGTLAVGRATTMPELVARAMPSGNERGWVQYVSVAPCADGAFWLVWSTSGLPSYYDRLPWSEREKAPEVGLFCKCVARDGKVIVPPLRIVEPVLVKLMGRPAGPAAFLAQSQPNGDLVVLANLRTPSDGASRIMEKRQTAVFSVSRTGRVRRLILDWVADISRKSWHDRVDAAFWPWHDTPGNLHYLLGMWERLVLHSELTSTDTSPELHARNTLFIRANGPTDSATLVTQNPGLVARTTLAWTGNKWRYSALLPLSDSTLLVVHDPAVHEQRYAWRDQRPWDTMVVYRLRVGDLSVVDSTRVAAKLVAGSDYAGVTISRAILERTPEGYVFLIGTSNGTTSYEFDREAKPMLGGRQQAQAGRATDADVSLDQFVSILDPLAPGVPRQIHWFGLTSAGRLCHESYPR